MKWIKWFLILLSLIDSAQSFESINFYGKLSDNKVISIAQDDTGFMWLGTEDGLNRFDGINSKIFRFGLDDENCICGNEILDILNDGRGSLWIATSNCLNKFNLNDYSFTHYTNDLNSKWKLSGNYISQLELVDGNLCISSENGLNILNLDTEQFSLIKLPPGASVKDVSILQEKNLLITTSIGLYTYSFKDKELLPFIEYFNIDYTKDNIQKAVIFESTLFIAYQKKIVKYDLKSLQ